MTTIYSDFLLHVSPFAVTLLGEFLRLSRNTGLRDVRAIVEVNRATLDAAVRGSMLTPVGASFIGVSWLRIAGTTTAQELCGYLAAHGLHVLPGDRFFWSDGSEGARYIRAALVRDPDVFAEAVGMLGELCLRLTDETTH